MKRKGKSNPCLLQLLLGFCMAAFSGSSACPKPCACYVPTEVHCTFRYLSTIPPHIPRNVERINLGYNNLVKLTERNFSGLEKLELLMLHSNQIHTVQDRTFSDLHLLQVLKMSYNKVKVVHADTFHGLTGLVRLHMDHNQIEFINPKAFYGLTSLKLVHLEGNILKQLHPDTFVTLCYLQMFKTSSIKHIYLSDNLLTSLPQDIFTYMSNLERLYLHGNPWICDCAMKWFAKWTEQNPDVVKCKKDRGSSGVLQCPLCSNPRTSKDKQLAELSLSDYNCIKPTIDTSLKTKKLTVPDDGDFTSISPKDFMAPMGSVTLNMTDQAQNRASLTCNVQNPSKMSSVTLQKMDNITVLKTSLLTFLVCSIEYEHIQQLWSILALYSNSPLKLKREQLLTEAPYLSYKYKQTESENEELFTDIGAELRAEPPWLMQEQISLQLDRTASTFNTLHIQYLMDAQITLPVAGSNSARQSWAMIFRGNNTRTEYSVLAGDSVELDCQAIGDPTPVIEWVLADGTKIRAPYVSEDGRMMVAKSGNLLLHAADSFDTGVYHCIGTNYEDADVLTFRITVIDTYMEHNHFNGPQLSVLLGEAVYLPCQSTATPDASVNWVLPEHIILHNSSKNKLLFQNDTLKIQQTTERDGGYVKCIAANQYGVDFLVYQILVKRLVNRSLDIQVEDEASEGSSDAEPEVIIEPQTPLQTEVTHQGFTKSSPIKRPILNKAKNNYKVIYRKNRDKISKRYRGRKRQFAPPSRRIDSLRWAAFLEKTKKNATLLITQEHARVKPTVNGLLSSKISGNEEETSGDDIFPEEEFMLLATKQPALYTLREASGNVMTAELGSVSSNYSSLATSGIVRELATPVTSPVVTLSEGPNSQELYMEVKHETERESFEEYFTLHIPPTYTESPTAPSSKLPSNVANISGTFHKLIPSEENNLDFKMTPTITPTANVIKKSQSVTAGKNTVKTHIFVEGNEEASRKLDNQVSVVTISALDDIFRQIYVYSTPKITTPKPPSVSTVITRQEIKRFGDATTHTPLYRRYGKRKKVSGRRRIVRPDCIPKLSSRRFPFVRPRQQESTCMPPLVEVSASALSPPYKFHEQITSQTPIPTSFKSQHAVSTTVNQILMFSRNMLDAGEQYTTSKTILFYPENSQVVSHTEVESITPLQTITDRNSSFITSLQTQTIYSLGNDKETESTKASISPSTIKSTIPTLETSTSSNDSAREIPWHNLFGSSHVQRGILEKQASLQTKPSTTLKKGGESLSVVSVIPVQTTVPVDSISPVYKTDLPKQESQTDGPTLPLGVTEPSSSTHSSSLTNFLEKEINATSMVPLPIPITAAHIENKISRPRMFGPGRRRGQRRRRPLKKFMSSQDNVISNKGITMLLGKRMTSTTLEMSKKATVSAGTIQTELFSKLTDTEVATARIQQPILSTEPIFKDNKSTTAAQIQERNTTSEHISTTNLPVNHLSSEKPVPLISSPESFLNVVSTTMVLPDTSLITLALASNEPTQATTVTDKDLYQHLEGKVVQGKQTTEAVLPTKTELSVQIPTDSVQPTVQGPSTLTSQSGVIPGVAITQTTTSPKWGKSPWNEPSSKAAESRKPFIVNMLTILKSSQSSTQYSPLKRKNNYVKSWSEKISDQESTTTNLIALNSFYQTRDAKPRIIGGKFAAFTVLANSDAFIPCEASGNPEPIIQWTKVSSSVDSPTHKHDNKLEILPNGTLSIQNVNVQDRGQYLCVAANQYGSDKLLVTLSVVTYPPRILGRRSKIITVHSGKSVTMKCTAEGRPIPTVSWILANKTYISESSIGNEGISFQTDGTLTIKKVSIYDRGIYTCTAHNAAGSDTVTLKLQVIAAPPIILEEKKQYVLGNRGESLMLPCTAKGNPHPGVHWVLFDGTEVRPLQYINGKLFLFPNGTLYIRNIAPSDNGNYECIATSSTGSERRVVNLQVEHGDTTPRIAVASQRLTQLNFGDRLLLNCSATGEPEPKIIWRLPSKAVVDQWHRMGSRIHVYPNGSLAVKAVTEKDEGDYICVARNKMGDDLILMKVSVTMKPAKIDEKHYFKKLVPYGKDFKVDCKASGSPEPEISWSLPDGTMINNVMQADDSGHRSRRYILFDNGTLYFNKIGVAEEGDYICYAQNTLGKDEMKVHITVVATAPHIKQNSKTYAKIKAGDSALFDCDATGEPKPKIFWLLPSNDMISASTQRYFLHVNGSLSVTKVRLIDAGEYICVARNSGGDDTKLYKLDVVSKPPLINGLYTNKTVIKMTAIKHSKKHIDCRAQGTPVPQIMWIMPDNIFLTAPYYGSRITVHKNGTLEIRNVRPSDSAEFICVARNDGGESILVVQLEVLEMLRRPVFRNPFNEKVIAKPGRNIFLNCSVDGNPPPEIIWMLPNGTRLFSGFRTHHYFLGSNGTLVINSPSKADVGKYRCAAKNKVGYIEKLIVLEVGQKPTIFIHSRGVIKSISGESLSLHCLAGGSPKPNIIWTVPSGYVLDHPQINGKYTLLENGTLFIRETTINDRGSYMCKAQNYVGESTVGVFVMIVAHPPRITNRPPRSIHTIAGVAVQLHCMALGVPTPEITWELPDHSVLSTDSKSQPSGNELLQPQGTLVIQNPKSSDSGIYKCMAKNQLGTDSTVTYVQVI